MNKVIKKLIGAVVGIFMLMNVVAFFHAYKFTHFADNVSEKTDPKKLSKTDKIKTLLLGINNPRPVNTTIPTRPYSTIKLTSNKAIECWYLKADSAKGTIVLFHGYSGMKSSMMDKAAIFLEAGYNTLLVDFMGSGGSEGNQTTIGYREAEQVKTCFDWLIEKGEKNIFLFGTSMGAVAIMKAINDYKIKPLGIIIECPFGSMYQTVCARFKMMNAPSFPMAGLLVFWGGVQNGFWAFQHNPIEYAERIDCPVLLFYGEKDDRVSRNETQEIYDHLKGNKTLITFPLAGHENYLNKYKPEWTRNVRSFLESHKN